MPLRPLKVELFPILIEIPKKPPHIEEVFSITGKSSSPAGPIYYPTNLASGVSGWGVRDIILVAYSWGFSPADIGDEKALATQLATLLLPTNQTVLVLSFPDFTSLNTLNNLTPFEIPCGLISLVDGSIITRDLPDTQADSPGLDPNESGISPPAGKKQIRLAKKSKA